MSASNNDLTSDTARLTPRATLLAGLGKQWEEHKRKAQDAAHTAQFHEREADRLWAEMRLLSQSASEAPHSAKSGAAASHGAATHVGRPAWRTDAEGA